MIIIQEVQTPRGFLIPKWEDYARLPSRTDAHVVEADTADGLESMLRTRDALFIPQLRTVQEILALDKNRTWATSSRNPSIFVGGSQDVFSSRYGSGKPSKGNRRIVRNTQGKAKDFKPHPKPSRLHKGRPCSPLERSCGQSAVAVSPQLWSVRSCGQSAVAAI